MKKSQKYFSFILFVALATYATIVLAGAPLKGISIRIGRVDGGKTYTATTDANGTFTIPNVAGGTYNLYVAYAACARAINTKGTGAVSRSTAGRFAIEIDGASDLTISSTTSKSVGIPALDGASKEGAYKTEITPSWTPATPGLTMTVAGKSKELTGHITLIK